jgi:hypothetical protein
LANVTAATTVETSGATVTATETAATHGDSNDSSSVAGTSSGTAAHSESFGSLPNAPTSAASGNGTTSADDATCRLLVGCGKCVDNSECVWCDEINACAVGNIVGVSKDALGGKGPDVCGDWKWKQCYVNGLVLLYAAGGVGACLLLSLVACVCKCVCFRAKRGGSGARQLDKFNKRDDSESLIPKNHNSKSAERRNALRAKWGLDSEA